MSSGPARGSGDLLADRRYAYAAGALADGDASPAADLARQVLDLVPRWVPAWMLLAAAEERLGRIEAAAEAFARAAALDAGGSFGADLHVARLGGAVPPGGMADAYVAALFDDYALRFDRHLVDGLGYRGPALLAEALTRLCGARRFGRALDLGCGTGLMGAAVRARVDRLEGVDLSPAMVAAAARKTLYDALQVGEVVRHLGALAPGSADLILAADVFVYLGTLEPVLAAAARALAPGGVLGFTVQTHDSPGVRLGADLRFSHPAPAVRAAVAGAGLTVEEVAAVSTRREGGVDVPGLAVMARLPGDATGGGLGRLSADTRSQTMTSATHDRSAKAQKAEDVQRAGSAKAGAGHPPVTEGGKADDPTEGKGKPKPAASRAHADSAPEAGTSSATAGKAEKEAAAEMAALTKTQHGRGHRKAE